MKWMLTLVSVLFASQLVMAQEGTTTTTAGEPAGLLSGFNLKTKVGVTATSGTLGELQTAEGARAATSETYEFSESSASGWGWAATGGWNNTFNGDAGSNVNDVNDPSFKVSHPIYKTDRLSVSGMARQFLPMSTKSTSGGVNKYISQYALDVGYKLPGRWDIEESISPRYVSQSSYQDSDTQLVAENSLDFVYNASSKVKIGAGNNLAMKSPHMGEATVVSDVHPFVRYTPVGNIELSGAINMPVYSSGPAGTPSVSTANANAEVAIKASL